MTHQSDKGGTLPHVEQPAAKPTITETAGSAAEQLSAHTKGKTQKTAKGVSSGAAYGSAAQQAGSTLFRRQNQSGHSGGAAKQQDQESYTNPTSTAQAISQNQIFGISHLVRLTIFVDKKAIPLYKYFDLVQTAVDHHSFSLVLDHDALGVPQNHEMKEAQNLLGKSITLTFSYKNLPEGTGPERNFIGVVTHVGFTREYGNRGNIILRGKSPTILLDAAPHIQSFGGSQVVSLFTIAQTLLKEGLGSHYKYKVDPKYTNNLSYSCQYNESHYNYLARIAASYGEQFFYDGRQVFFGKLPPQEKSIKLTFGKDVEEIDIQLHARHVKPSLYGYNSSMDKRLSTGETKIDHRSSLAKEAYSLSEKTFLTPSVRIAPIKAGSNKDVETAQKSATAHQALGVFITTGKTSVPFLYPGCTVDLYMRRAHSAEEDYMTKLMITDIRHSVDTLGHYSGEFQAVASDTGYLPAPAFHTPIAEPQFARVTDNKDSQGRIQVKFDWQTGSKTTAWIRVMSPDAGGSEKVSKNRGFMAIPEVGDQVMVGFVHHHPDRPYVMGGLFHGKIGGGGGAGNNIKSLSSKSGHTVELNDGGGITIRDKTGANMIIIDGTDSISGIASKSITLTNGKSTLIMDEENISIKAEHISINASSLVTIDSGGANISVASKDNIAAISGETVIASASSEVQISGKSTKISGDKLSMDGSDEASITGGLVKINS
ncbi:Vgr family protein [Elizabethkingia argentiflava]|uniref:Vgr family protein n=1 Tax=Elizabethkingia argenteiflava TaxID=2681556 RepID=A0A845PSN9_9FLAO|nr:phage baseplate assembly protein V [Elizabethkingia argenteiflava]NAW50033.1 Vgr family protein [Elizabethkingia argenteiflava]